MVTDSHGNPVHSKEALNMRDALLEKLGALRVPDGPLELLLNTFGPGMVAEVTGRKERVLRTKEDAGMETVQRQKRTPAAVREDVAAYMAGKKRILVFSDKGAPAKATTPTRPSRTSNSGFTISCSPAGAQIKPSKGWTARTAPIKRVRRNTS